MKEWKYYNHAMIPTVAPHEEADVETIYSKDFWKENKNALLARWTSDFDCGYETNWWYVIKDDPFDITTLKSKRRYEINKGKKNFDVRLIDASKYAEKLGINAAIVAGILEGYTKKGQFGKYICDGARSISHETNFQDYLEKYFGFRKAYCKLHIAYNPRVKWIVKMLFPFRKMLHRFDQIGFVHQINSVLYMEELCRSEAVSA